MRAPRLTLKALNPRFCERSGRFSASEWAVQIMLPVLVVLLGARTPPYPKPLNPRFCERSGRFSASEWAVQIVLPVLVVLLGARAPPYPKSPEP